MRPTGDSPLTPVGLLPGLSAAINWTRSLNILISAVIVGPRTRAHLEGVYGALELVLGQDDEVFINELVVSGHELSPRFNDLSYPFLSRRL